MNKFYLFFITLLFTSCTSDSEYLKHHEWKANGGYSIGDWLSFDNSGYFEIKNDTLYKNDSAVAILVGIDPKISGERELNIKSLKTGQNGTYIEK